MALTIPYIDPSELTDDESTYSLLNLLIQEELQTDVLEEKTRFNAVVLENPVSISAPLYESSGLKPRNPVGQFKFRAQILDKPSPHAIFNSGLDPEQSKTVVNQLERIIQFTEFYSTERSSHSVPQKDDHVIVELRYNVHSYNLVSGEYVGPVMTKGYNPRRRRNTVVSSQGAFKEAARGKLGRGGGAVGLVGKDPGICDWSSGAAQYYTTWDSIEYPQWNGTFLRNGDLKSTGMLLIDEKSGAELIPPAMDDFLKLAAAFEVKFPGKTLQGSGYRSYAGQVYQRIRRNANKCGSGSKTAGGSDIGVTARPGTSNHGWGAAVDLKSMGSKYTKYFKWVNKFSKDFNFVFGVSSEHWHIDWMKFGEQVGGAVSTPQVSWTKSGQNDDSITKA